MKRARRRWRTQETALVAGLLLATAAGAAEAPASPAPVLAGVSAPAGRDALDNAQLRRLVTSNQIVFRGSGATLEAVCYCGPKLPLQRFHKVIQDAVVAVEDRRFLEHRGVDVQGTTRAFLQTLFGRTQGGSTITQQLIKNTVLSPTSSIDRKWREAKLAIQLEGDMTKPEILAAYLNQVVLAHDHGRPIVGFDQAARYYFGRSALDVNLLEAATLVGMLKAPARYNPIENAPAAFARAQTVLQKMLEQGVITERQRTAALKGARPRGRATVATAETRSYVQWTLGQLKAAGVTYAADAETRIPITLDYAAQGNADAALRARFQQTPIPDAEVGYVALAADGGVVAMVGQRDFARKQINFVTATNSQPASTFKTFLFAAALESGKAIVDRALTDALAASDNTTAKDLGRKVGIGYLVEFVRRLGIVSKMRPDDSIFLGTSEVSLLELTHAYLPFLSDGWTARPFAAFGLVQGGAPLHWHRADARRVLTPAVARATRQMLRAVVLRGTGAAAKAIPAAAGKTGTSDDFRDAWFVGMTGGHVSGIWLGREDDRPMDGVAGKTAAAFWAAAEAALGHN